MKKKLHLALAMGLLAAIPGAYASRYVGGDISLLPEYDKATYYAPGTNTRVSDFLTYSAEAGMNAMRVRLFVDPSKYKGTKDPNACQDLEYIIPICQRIKDAGCALLLDFHYSDSWADPVKQFTPTDWEGLGNSRMYSTVYEYTKQVLTTLKEDYGIVPELIQPGNEISYGMLWGAYTSNSNSSSLKKCTSGSEDNWEYFTNLLKYAIQACNEVCPDAKIILHTERVANQGVMTNFYDQMKNYGVDYDIIGLSYYPYHHGNLNVLKSALNTLTGRYPEKDIMMVEVGYPINWAVTDSPKSQDYPLTDAGQNDFAKDLVALLTDYKNCTGLFWWWMEYNAHGTSLTGWYNASLVDNKTGRITSAHATIAAYADEANDGNGSGSGGDNEDDTDNFYLLYNGNTTDWFYPGTKLTNEGNGIYSLSNVYIGHPNEDYGWFVLDSSGGSSWGEVSASLHGAPSANYEAEPGKTHNVVKGSSDSFQIPNGTYSLTFDSTAMTLTVTNASQSGVGGFESEPEGVAVYYNLQGMPVENPQRGIFIRVRGNKTEKVIM